MPSCLAFGAAPPVLPTDQSSRPEAASADILAKLSLRRVTNLCGYDLPMVSESSC